MPWKYKHMKSRLAVVSQEAKKKQHAVCLLAYYSKLFTRMAALSFYNAVA